MRVTALTAAFVLATVTIAGAQNRESGLCRVICGPSAPARPAPKPAPKAAPKPGPIAVRPLPPRHIARRHVRRPLHRYAREQEGGSYYSYREAENRAVESHAQWQVAPNDAAIPGPPMAYYPPPAYPPPGPPCDCGDAVHVDQSGWTGGVGYAASEMFVDGYGMVHYGGGFNGPTYNSYGQSFQFNPSMAAPFQPRVMGGFAVGGRVGGVGIGARGGFGGFGPRH